MLESIQNFFSWFVGIFESIFTFIESLLRGIGDMLKALPSAITFLTSGVGNLPPVVAVFATLTITISVVYLIANRETGG